MEALEWSGDDDEDPPVRWEVLANEQGRNPSRLAASPVDDEPAVDEPVEPDPRSKAAFRELGKIGDRNRFQTCHCG